MAQTYTLAAAGVSFALNKAMLGVFNGAGSGRIVRVYRIWMLNNGVTAITGALTSLELRRLTAGSGGVAITPVKHDTTNETFPAQIVVATNPTVTTSTLYRRVVWSTDEATGNASATIDELETLVPFGLVWDVGYDEPNVDPITLREGEGLALVNVSSVTTGSVDVFFEVTLAST